VREHAYSILSRTILCHWYLAIHNIVSIHDIPPKLTSNPFWFRMSTSPLEVSRYLFDVLGKSGHSMGVKRTQTELRLDAVTLDTLAPMKKPTPEWLLGAGTEEMLKRPPNETRQGRGITLPALSELVAGLPGLTTLPSRRCAILPSPCATCPGTEHPQSEASSSAKRRSGYDQAHKAVDQIEARNQYRSDAAERNKNDLKRQKNREKQRRFRGS
jgi:hypothetical protein